MKGMERSTDATNSGVSIVRVVSDAVVQEPAGWRSFIDQGKKHAKGFGPSNVGYEALDVLSSELEKLPSVPTRAQIQALAESLMQNSDGTIETPRLAKAMTPQVLAGQSLLLSLRR